MKTERKCELASRIGEGLLAFPVTHFDEQGEFVEGRYREHIAWLVENDPAALFAAGGTGEYFALTLADHANVVAAAVDEAAGRVPVLAGCGDGTRMAMEFTRAAEQAGADGLLLFPPYLVNAEPAGLIAHARGLRFHAAWSDLLQPRQCGAERVGAGAAL